MRHIEELRLSAFLDGEVSEEERAEILKHLRTCSHCRKEIEELSQASDLLVFLGEVPVSPYFFARLKRQIGEQESKTRVLFRFVEWIRRFHFERIIIPAGVAACLFVAVLTGRNLGKAIYETGMRKEWQVSEELADALDMTFLDDYPEGSLGGAYNSLLIGGEE